MINYPGRRGFRALVKQRARSTRHPCEPAQPFQAARFTGELISVYFLSEPGRLKNGLTLRLVWVPPTGEHIEPASRLDGGCYRDYYYFLIKPRLFRREFRNPPDLYEPIGFLRRRTSIPRNDNVRQIGFKPVTREGDRDTCVSLLVPSSSFLFSCSLLWFNLQPPRLNLATTSRYLSWRLYNWI